MNIPASHDEQGCEECRYVMVGKRGETMKKNLAVIIPGIGYPAEQPLFYYAGKIAENHGYEVKRLDLTHISAYRPGRTKAQVNAISEALVRSLKELETISYNAYDHVLIISKDAGSMIAAHCVERIADLSSHENLTQILFAPIAPALKGMRKGAGVVFAGSADPYAPIEEIRALCREQQLVLHVAEGADQCLETGIGEKTLRILYQVMQFVEQLITEQTERIYDFTIRHPERGEVSMKAYEGEVLLIVNTATGCGFTPQYETLEYLYKTYHKEGFTVLDCPCDQFGHQAPGTDDEIHQFCTSRYDISYPQFSKIEVNGKNEIPLYTFLKKRQGFHGFDLDTQAGAFLHKKLLEMDPAYADSADIKWNFTKFLITRQGKVIARFEPTDDLKAVEEAVKAALG